ncbi:MAG: recombination regulator RecX [Ideonella sp.]|nr:recombination regulator RecX [Ideonella sp.]MCC7456007.1 recombination regulator RecX [Nitrospira sp.]
MQTSNRARRPPSLKARALQWLAQREHSRHELRAKLLRAAATAASTEGGGDDEGAATAAAIDALLDQLAAQGHLSDARFVESRIHARAARYGNRRIEHELRQHGLVIEGAAQRQLHGSECARAREVWRKKFGGQAAADAAGRARQMRFLAARGFSPDVVRRVVSAPDDAELDAEPGRE